MDLKPSHEPKQGDVQRLFFALCPDVSVRTQISGLIIEQLPQGLGRWVPIGNTHITLVFLGSIDKASGRCVEQVAAQISAEEFCLTLDRIGYWSRPRILWLGPTQIQPSLLGLVSNLRSGLKECGIDLGDWPYQAHMTLARKAKKPPHDINVEQLKWTVNRYSLMESIPNDNGSGVCYRELNSWSLN